MSVDLVEGDEARDRAIGVVLALTASSMLGVTLVFARLALGARGPVPHVGWGLAVTAAFLFPSPGLSPRQRSTSSVVSSREGTLASGSGIGREAAACEAFSAVKASGAVSASMIGDRSPRDASEIANPERRIGAVGVAEHTVAPNVTSVRTLTTRFIEGVFLPLGGRLGGGLILALLVTNARHTSPLVTALFAWHATHAVLAAITRNATLTRFTALAWFAVALAVWGPA